MFLWWWRCVNKIHIVYFIESVAYKCFVKHNEYKDAIYKALFMFLTVCYMYQRKFHWIFAQHKLKWRNKHIKWPTHEGANWRDHVKGILYEVSWVLHLLQQLLFDVNLLGSQSNISNEILKSFFPQKRILKSHSYQESANVTIDQVSIIMYPLRAKCFWKDDG